MNARMEKHLETVKFLREAEAASGDLQSRIAFCKAYLDRHAPSPKPQPPTLPKEDLDLIRQSYNKLVEKCTVQYKDDFLTSNNLTISAPEKNNLTIQPSSPGYWRPVENKTEKFTATYTIPQYLYQCGDAETIRNEEYHGLKRSVESLISPMIKAGCIKIDSHLDCATYDKIHTIRIEAAVLKDKP